MRILYHHRTLADGAEGIHIQAMADAFRSLGHDVEVRGLAASPDDSRPASTVRAVRALLPNAAFELASASLNVPEYVALRRRLRAARPGLLYKRHARYDVAALAAARREGVPSILEVNSLFTAGAYAGFEPPALRGLSRRFEARALELATVVVAVSTPLAEQARLLGARRVLTLPNGVDVRRFDPDRADRIGIRRRLNLGKRLTIGWSGILREWHGLHLLLEALPALPDACLLVVGDGPARDDFERRAAALGVSGRVIVTGRVPHASMPDYVAAMDVAVVPDERTGVASPMKLIEYMAMARAVVAPRMPNIEDVVRDGRDAMLFTPGSADELGGCLRSVAVDAELRGRLGREARVAVEERRTWQRNAEAVLAAVHAE